MTSIRIAFAAALAVAALLAGGTQAPQHAAPARAGVAVPMLRSGPVTCCTDE